ncbi:unnamed protein product [Clavelina lepadiformis]|uniref:Uncharacterized protein n=1 Tax=Clavelina lepadiformis TaxID=159417 RepID=A0ABP0G2S0_CLALP
MHALCCLHSLSARTCSESCLIFDDDLITSRSEISSFSFGLSKIKSGFTLQEVEAEERGEVLG